MPKHPSFGDQLLKWWRVHGRRFPWRETRDPYKILISEVLLHRTRAEQVAPVYLKFIEKYPDLNHLYVASGDDVKRLLRTLGLDWRVRLLNKMVPEIVERYGGKIPSSDSELETLPGVSRYISSAVRSFAFDQPDVLLDTNIVRVIGRLFGIPVIDGSRRSKRFADLYRKIVDRRSTREFNYALIDLGALVCRPKHPKCGQCPAAKICQYATSEEVQPNASVIRSNLHQRHHA